MRFVNICRLQSIGGRTLFHEWFQERSVYGGGDGMDKQHRGPQRPAETSPSRVGREMDEFIECIFCVECVPGTQEQHAPLSSSLSRCYCVSLHDIIEMWFLRAWDLFLSLCVFYLSANYLFHCVAFLLQVLLLNKEMYCTPLSWRHCEKFRWV